jgi:SOS response regulatory protein OraA/RecX
MPTKPQPLVTLEDAWEAAVDLLARKARSAGEVAKALKARGASDEHVEAVVSRLKAHRHVDDTALAEDEAFALVDGNG